MSLFCLTDDVRWSLVAGRRERGEVMPVPGRRCRLDHVGRAVWLAAPPPVSEGTRQL